MAMDVTRDESTRYTDEQKEFAFRVWCFQANRNASATVRILAEDEEQGFQVSRISIGNWARTHNWEDRANRDLFAGAPALRFKAQAALILAAPDAAEFQRKMINLDESLRTERKVYDKDGNHVLTELVFDDKVLKLRQTSSQLVLDRTGFSPVGTRDVGGIDAPPEIATDVRQALGPDATTDQIKAMEDYIKSRVGMGNRS